METYRVQIPNTRHGDIGGWVRSADLGYVAFVDGTEHPHLAGVQALPGEPMAMTVEDAVEQLRRAINSR